MASWRSMWWADGDAFARDARRADDERLVAMHMWAADREQQLDARGPGRNAKARRLFNSMRRAAAEELERRGLSF